MSSVGIRKGKLSEVSGLTALPRPEFWHITTVRRPASQAPAAMATASPSLAAPTYSMAGSPMTRLMIGVRNEHGTPA